MIQTRRLRAALACLFALALAIVLGGGGCANGGGTSAGGGDDGSSGDVTAETGGETGGEASACAPPRTMCGATCTNTGTDSKNCGKCGNMCPTGQVCSMGACGYSCTPPETLCGVNEGGAPTMDASGGNDTGSPEEAGGVDATLSDAMASEAGGGSMDAAGSTQPYCANTNNDPNNCGGCGMPCGPMQTCQNGSCACGMGQKICIASGTCIPNNSCCNSGDCTISGEICPSPGGNCACPGGERECSATSSCISSNSCCQPADCTVAGSTCQNPGQACVCSMAGYKACLGFNACLPNAECCIGSDCATLDPAPHVLDYTCTPSGMPPTSSACGIKDCDPGCYDLDKQYTDGCECCNDSVGKSCAAATALGSLTLGAAAITTPGKLPNPTDGDWFQVTFNNESNTAFHALVSLTTGGGEFVFDVIQGSCTGGPLTCGTEGGNSTGKTTWEEQYSGLTWVAGNPPAEFQPIPAIGAVWIHVYRADTSKTSCNSFTLSVQE
jgi:hypothetical protein